MFEDASLWSLKLFAVRFITQNKKPQIRHLQSKLAGERGRF